MQPTSSEPCIECFSNEFHPRKLLLRGQDASLFVNPQWRIAPVVFLLYRLGVAILFPVWVLFDAWTESSMFYSSSVSKWLLFASNWAFVLLAVTAVLHAILCIYYQCKINKHDFSDDSLPVSIQLYWVIYNISANASVAITISFWTFLTVLDHADYLDTSSSRIKHTLTSGYVIVDLMLVATPIHVFHCVYTILALVIYAIFNAIYFACGGRGPKGDGYVYPMLDWKNTAEAFVTLVIECLLSTIVQFLLFSIYRLRISLYRKCCHCHGRRVSTEAESELVNILEQPKTVGLYNATTDKKMASHY